MDSSADIQVDETSKKLFCKGFQFDVVEFVSLSSNDTYDCGKVARDWIQWLNNLSFPLSSGHGSYVSGDSAEEALCHTLVADCDRAGVDLAYRGCSADISLTQAMGLVA